MTGWTGKILRVNLGKGTIRLEDVEAKRLKDYIGARGLGVSYLLDEGDPTCDPLSPKNPLIMMTGPLTGTAAPTGARYVVTTKSPLTGAITVSNSGGQFPAAVKRCGIDGFIFEGVSDHPVYLVVTEGGKAELRDAAHLWGKDTHETDRLCREAVHNDAKVASIGPAGENGVLFAAIMNDMDRAAGRAGTGAVMGSKKLKAVVVHGTKPVPLHDEAEFKAVVKEHLEKFKNTYKDAPPALRTHGTAITIIGTNVAGTLPTRNFRAGQFEGWEAIGGEALTAQYLVKPRACHSCPIACGRVTKIPDGPFAGEGEGPEYETVYALGSDCGVSDLAALTKANYLCNELGLDTISMGSTIACAMELFDLGLIDEKTVGRSLRFGDGAAVVEMVRKTAMKEGFGADLAQGSLRLATKYGRPELAIVSKGLDFAGYDPRAEKGMGLNYATSPIGASHMRGDVAYIELLGVPFKIDPLTFEDKSVLVKDWQDVFCVIDAAGLCVFFAVRNLTTPTRDIRPVGIMRLLNAATGAGYTIETLMEAAERIFNAERLFLTRAGFSGKDDTLPPRITREPSPSGPAKGHVCELEKMLPAYYEARGWTPDGRPTPEKLRQLGLSI